MSEATLELARIVNRLADRVAALEAVVVALGQTHPNRAAAATILERLTLQREGVFYGSPTPDEAVSQSLSALASLIATARLTPGSAGTSPP